eukprot:97150-Amorphochlora_amoeboformis.AAC.1
MASQLSHAATTWPLTPTATRDGQSRAPISLGATPVLRSRVARRLKSEMYPRVELPVCFLTDFGSDHYGL